MRINLIVDNVSLYEEEISSLKKYFESIKSNIFMLTEVLDSNFCINIKSDIDVKRFNTFLISRNCNMFFIKLNDGTITLPTFIRIDDSNWSKNEWFIDAKVNSIDDFFNGNFYTLFGEKFAYYGNYNKAEPLTRYMVSNLTIEPFNSLKKTITIYSLGRYFGRKHRLDSLNVLSTKLLTKFKDNKPKKIGAFKLFIEQSFNYFLTHVGKEYDIVCYIPTKKGQFNRFEPLGETIIRIKDNASFQNYHSLETKLERKKALANYYCLDENANVKDKTILVIDDISTTGATFESAANLLFVGGAKSVDCLCIGHTFRYDDSVVGEGIKCAFAGCDGTLKFEFKNNTSESFIVCNKNGKHLDGVDEYLKYFKLLYHNFS